MSTQCAVYRYQIWGKSEHQYSAVRSELRYWIRYQEGKSSASASIILHKQVQNLYGHKISYLGQSGVIVRHQITLCLPSLWTIVFITFMSAFWTECSRKMMHGRERVPVSGVLRRGQSSGSAQCEGWERKNTVGVLWFAGQSFSWFRHWLFPLVLLVLYL